MSVSLYLPPTLPFGANPDADAIIPTSLLTLKSVHLIENYTSHVSVNNGQSLGTLDLETGNFDQLGSGSNLTITTYLGFLGGTLNSTDNLGSVVHITGSLYGAATANISPQVNAITVGSTISVEGFGTGIGGAGLGIYLGDYTIKNAADIVTGDYCSTVVGQTPPPGGLNVVASKVFFVVQDAGAGANTYAKYITVGKGYCNFVGNFEGKVKLVDGGVMTISSGATVKLTDPVDPASSYSAQVAGTGKFSIDDGCKLIAPNGVVVAGTFSTVYVAGLTVAQTVKIEGALTILATGALKMTDGAMADQFGRLEVTGDIVIAGTLQMEVNGIKTGESESVESDFITTPDSLAFLAGSKLKIAATNSTAPMRVNRIWNLVEATKFVIGNVPVPDGPFNATKQQTNQILQAAYLGE